MMTLSIRISVDLIGFLRGEVLCIGWYIAAQALVSYYIRNSIKHGSCTLKEKVGVISTRPLLHDNSSDLVTNPQI